MTTSTPLADPRSFLLSLFDAAVAAASPALCLPRHLPPPPRGRTIVLGAGKAAAAMAQAVEAHWRGALEGLVITRYGHGAACRQIEVVEAAHPVPDASGLAATQRMRALLRGLLPDDLVLFLASGGGSALLVEPAPGLTLEDKQEVTRALLKSGADIHAINCVRKHVSGVKGGRLALAAQPASVHGLIISDVTGDDPAAVASGPTAPDPTTRADARGVLLRHGIAAPAVEAWLAQPQAETPKPGDPRLLRVRNVVIAGAGDALAGAARAAEAAGIRPVILGDALSGEASALGRAHAALALEALRGGTPCVLLSGGETTVTLRGRTGAPARGGRNGEYLLALGLGLRGAADVWAIACDTDGIDGTEDNAGAVLGPETLARAAAKGIDPEAALARNDSHAVFACAGALVRTGPTRTNVSDFRAVSIGWCGPAAS